MLEIEMRRTEEDIDLYVHSSRVNKYPETTIVKKCELMPGYLNCLPRNRDIRQVGMRDVFLGTK